MTPRYSSRRNVHPPRSSAVSSHRSVQYLDIRAASSLVCPALCNTYALCMASTALLADRHPRLLQPSICTSKVDEFDVSLPRHGARYCGTQNHVPRTHVAPVVNKDGLFRLQY